MDDYALTPVDYDPFLGSHLAGAASAIGSGVQQFARNVVPWAAAQGKNLLGAVTLPHDVMTGQADVNTPEGFARAQMLAGLMTGGAGAAPAEADALNMGMRRPNISGMAGDPESVISHHATWSDPFDEIDMSKLGTNTAENQIDDDTNSWAMNLAKAGFWTADKGVAEKMAAPNSYPFALSGKMKSFNSLDELEAEIQNAGGPEAFRDDMVSRGFSHAKVNDEEFGGTSYVTFDPDAAVRLTSVDHDPFEGSQ